MGDVRRGMRTADGLETEATGEKQAACLEEWWLPAYLVHSLILLFHFSAQISKLSYYFESSSFLN